MTIMSNLPFSTFKEITGFQDSVSTNKTSEIKIFENLDNDITSLLSADLSDDLKDLVMGIAVKFTRLYEFYTPLSVLEAQIEDLEATVDALNTELKNAKTKLDDNTCILPEREL